ncbi:hypothetical protein LguiB_001418 [Lonicera macranthoides]
MYFLAIGALSNHQSQENKQEFLDVEELNESPKSNPFSFDRKLSESVSIGSDSRSFSGNFFERNSTRFGESIWANDQSGGASFEFGCIEMIVSRCARMRLCDDGAGLILGFDGTELTGLMREVAWTGKGYRKRLQD